MGGMTTTRHHPFAAPKFVALELALELIRSLRGLQAQIRRHDSNLANQLVKAASSVAANVAEGNRRTGKDRLHLFRIAAGSADETRTHLRVAEAWGYITRPQTTASLDLADRQLAILYKLTH